MPLLRALILRNMPRLPGTEVRAFIAFAGFPFDVPPETVLTPKTQHSGFFFYPFASLPAAGWHQIRAVLGRCDIAPDNGERSHPLCRADFQV